MSSLDHSGAPAVSLRKNILVWLLLLALTALTVSVAYVDLGFFHVAVALAVATAKAGLVVLYFMHLRYASLAIRTMVFAAFFLLAIAVGFTFFDVAYR